MPLSLRRSAVSPAPDGVCHGHEGVSVVIAAAAADRLFDDFVVLVMISVAIAIAMFVAAALRKMVRGY